MKNTDIPILDDDGVTKVEARRARCLDNKNQSRLAEASILIASDIPALCQTVRALRAKHEWLRSKIAWHRDGVGPDVPVLQERYDKLIAQRNDLQSQLEQLTKERDAAREVATAITIEKQKVESVATSMRSACVEKVKAMRDEWEVKRNGQEPLSKLRNRYDAGFCAASEIITALESVSIQGQEK